MFVCISMYKKYKICGRKPLTKFNSCTLFCNTLMLMCICAAACTNHVPVITTLLRGGESTVVQIQS